MGFDAGFWGKEKWAGHLWVDEFPSFSFSYKVGYISRELPGIRMFFDNVYTP